MINKNEKKRIRIANKWLNTSIKKNDQNDQNDQNIQNDQKLDQLVYDTWINTISKKKEENLTKKYSFMFIVFICGLIFVSLVKNETRSLQKEIIKLNASIKVVKFNLEQAILDNEVITSPENISSLAKEHLNTNLSFYNRIQIIKLDDKSAIIKKKKVDNYSTNKKSIVSIKKHVVKKFTKKKMEFQSVIDSPKDKIFSDRAARWGAMQIVKALLGLPAIPGK